jgi:hypothetical protein
LEKRGGSCCEPVDVISIPLLEMRLLKRPPFCGSEGILKKDAKKYLRSYKT